MQAMIRRALFRALNTALASSPVVALLGPRQVGKTTLALEVAKGRTQASHYLDLERDSDLNKLADAELYLSRQAGKLVVLDEIQRLPDLFRLLRSLVDERLRAGERGGQFLVLGSASRDLLRQSSESLAGRIQYLELKPFSPLELMRHGEKADLHQLWLRGGFPPSYLASSEKTSWDWRTSFIATYLERDIPQLGPRIAAEQLKRLWSMLAHGQGNMLNASKLATSLGVSANTVRSYIDLLADLYMVRQLPPWSGNSRKRLVKSPKTFVRDSGLCHRLANLPDLETLLGHPLCGSSWEGFALESLLAFLPDTWRASYYRTSAQAEIDLVLEGPRREVIAIEVKRSATPKVDKGFQLGCEDVRATRRYYALPVGEKYPIGYGTEAIALIDLLELLGAEWEQFLPTRRPLS